MQYVIGDVVALITGLDEDYRADRMYHVTGVDGTRLAINEDRGGYWMAATAREVDADDVTPVHHHGEDGGICADPEHGNGDGWWGERDDTDRLAALHADALPRIHEMQATL